MYSVFTWNCFFTFNIEQVCRLSSDYCEKEWASLHFQLYPSLWKTTHIICHAMYFYYVIAQIFAIRFFVFFHIIANWNTCISILFYQLQCVTVIEIGIIYSLYVEKKLYTEIFFLFLCDNECLFRLTPKPRFILCLELQGGMKNWCHQEGKWTCH